MSLRAWLLVVAALGCGEGSGQDAAPGEGTEATAEQPIDDPDPLAIDQLDDNRFIIDADAVVQLGVDHAAGRVAVKADKRGYRITELSGAALAAKLGLVKGDLIRGVNNVEMTQPGRLQRAWNRARRDQRVEILLERDGAVVELRWIFSKAAETMLDELRPSFVDRRDPPETYTAVVELARTGLAAEGVHRYKLDRAVLQALAEHPRLGERSLAAVWSARGSHRGVTVGEGSIYAAMGISRFDVIKGVNADDIIGASDLQRRLAAQAGAADLSISVVRLDEPVILRYQLVDSVIDEAAWTRALRAWKEADEVLGAFTPRDPDIGGLSPPTPRKPIDGIKRIDDNTFEIDRKVFDVLSDPSVARGARVVPSIKNGKPNGFKLYAIRPSSIHHQLGFKNGDTVLRINGRSTATPSDLIDIYQRIKSAKVISVEVSRRGKPTTLTYRVKK